MIRKIIFGTRGSPLALIQTKSVISRLQKCFPDVELVFKIIETFGDKDQNTSLKLTEHLGYFATEIQNALLENEIDVAVHSLKDLPINSSDLLKIGAIPERIEPSDILYHPKGLSIHELPKQATVGTCSLRRAGQIKHIRKDLNIIDIRGNIEMRMQKVKNGEYDATILASAGLIRLNIDITKFYSFSLNEIIPAPGQGALALEIRKDESELEKILVSIDNPNIRNSIEIERGVLEKFGGGCSLPIGVVSFVNGQIDTYACLVNPVSGEKYGAQEINWKGSKTKLIESISKQLIHEEGIEIINRYNKHE